jgi:predicted ATPase
VLKLNKISLEGYKSIRRCRDLKLEKLNVLIGANGSGKSNFLSFFKLLYFEMSGALQEFIGRNGGRDSLLYLGAKVTPRMTAGLELTSITEQPELTSNWSYYYRMTLSDAPPDTLIFTEEIIPGKMVLIDGDQTKLVPGAPLYLGAGHRESALFSPALAKNEIAQLLRNTLGGFRFYQFHDTSDQSHMRSRSDLRGPSYLLPDGRNLAAHLHMLREKQAMCYQRVVETVRLVFPIFRDFVLEPDNGGGNFVMLRWRAVGSAEYDFGPHQISDGTLRFIALAALLLQPQDWMPSLITIDEPELGLHPYAIKILASLLQDASNFTQIIVATQSASLVDQMEPDDVIVANMVDGATQFERQSSVKLKEWLDEYTLSELWEKNVVGGRP